MKNLCANYEQDSNSFLIKYHHYSNRMVENHNITEIQFLRSTACVMEEYFLRKALLVHGGLFAQGGAVCSTKSPKKWK